MIFCLAARCRCRTVMKSSHLPTNCSDGSIWFLLRRTGIRRTTAASRQIIRGKNPAIASCSMASNKSYGRCIAFRSVRCRVCARIRHEPNRSCFHKGVERNIDSYSTFFDNAHRRHTGLADYLKERSIKDIYLMGLALDYCVKYSALDAHHLGLNTHVILDGCRGIELESGDIDRALDEMRRAGATILKSADL